MKIFCLKQGYQNFHKLSPSPTRCGLVTLISKVSLPDVGFHMQPGDYDFFFGEQPLHQYYPNLSFSFTIAASLLAFLLFLGSFWPGHLWAFCFLGTVFLYFLLFQLAFIPRILSIISKWYPVTVQLILNKKETSVHYQKIIIIKKFQCRPPTSSIKLDPFAAQGYIQKNGCKGD